MTTTIKKLYDKVNDGKIVSDIELQREIIYSVEKQRLVIDSIVKGIPLPAFYFWKNENGILEVLDGKQRYLYKNSECPYTTFYTEHT